MAPTGDALTVVVAFGVGSGVCVCAAAVRGYQGAGVGSLPYFAAPVVAGRRDGCGVAEVHTWLARAKALCPLAMCRVTLSADLPGSRSATGVSKCTTLADYYCDLLAARAVALALL